MRFQPAAADRRISGDIDNRDAVFAASRATASMSGWSWLRTETDTDHGSDRHPLATFDDDREAALPSTLAQRRLGSEEAADIEDVVRTSECRSPGVRTTSAGRARDIVPA